MPARRQIIHQAFRRRTLPEPESVGLVTSHRSLQARPRNAWRREPGENASSSRLYVLSTRSLPDGLLTLRRRAHTARTPSFHELQGTVGVSGNSASPPVSVHPVECHPPRPPRDPFVRCRPAILEAIPLDPIIDISRSFY